MACEIVIEVARGAASHLRLKEIITIICKEGIA